MKWFEWTERSALEGSFHCSHERQADTGGTVLLHVPSFFHAQALSVQRLIFWIMIRAGKSTISWVDFDTWSLLWQGTVAPGAKAVCLLHGHLGWNFLWVKCCQSSCNHLIKQAFLWCFWSKWEEKKIFDTCMFQCYVLHVRAAVLMFSDQSWRR